VTCEPPTSSHHHLPVETSDQSVNVSGDSLKAVRGSVFRNHCQRETLGGVGENRY